MSAIVKHESPKVGDAQLMLATFVGCVKIQSFSKKEQERAQKIWSVDRFGREEFSTVAAEIVWPKVRYRNDWYVTECK